MNSGTPVAQYPTLFEDGYAERVAELRPALGDKLPLLCIGDAPAWARSWHQALADAPDRLPEQLAQPADTALMVYTSGTTGKPKGVLLGNEGMVETAREYAVAMAALPNDRVLIVMPYYHIGATAVSFTYLLVGATIVLHRAFDAEQILDSMQQHRATASHFAPTMIQMKLDVQECAPRDLSPLHTVLYGSAPMSVALSQRVRATFGEIFLQIYGMTEQGIGTILYRHQHFSTGTPKQVGRLASAGQPFLNTEIKIIRDDGSTCATGESGERVQFDNGEVMLLHRKQLIPTGRGPKISL